MEFWWLKIRYRVKAKFGPGNHFSGTHTGPLRGMAATGNKVTYEVFDILKIRDGKIADRYYGN